MVKEYLKKKKKKKEDLKKNLGGNRKYKVISHFGYVPKIKIVFASQKGNINNQISLILWTSTLKRYHVHFVDFKFMLVPDQSSH